jgi:hypothetical protein
MATRRELLKAGAAGSVLPLSGLASMARASEPLAVQRAVYDDRFAEGLAFAREAGGRGWPLRAIRGDVTDLWFHDLHGLWKQGPAPVAGLTARDSLFCLERLAWDAGLRVVSREEAAGSPLVSWLIAPPLRTLA